MPNEMEELEFYLKKAKQVVYEVKKTVVGKDEAICKLLMAILAKGHTLTEACTRMKDFFAHYVQD